MKAQWEKVGEERSNLPMLSVDPSNKKQEGESERAANTNYTQPSSLRSVREVLITLGLVPDIKRYLVVAVEAFSQYTCHICL